VTGGPLGNLGLATVTQDNMASDSVDTPQLVENSVHRDQIQDGEVVHGKLGAGAVDNPALAAQAVSADKILNHTITALQIAPGTITPTEISGGSTIPVGTIAPSKMVTAVSEPSLMVVGTTTGYAQYATIGGVLSATLVGTVLTFAINSTTSTGATLTLVVQNGTGNITGGAWDTRGSLLRLVGADTVAFVSATHDEIDIVANGTYLVLFQAAGHLCDGHVTALFNGATAIAVGSQAFAPVGSNAQTSSSGFAVVIVTGATSVAPYKLSLKTWGVTAASPDGQGLVAALGAVTANTAQVLLIKL
jgi:hypothetical protein